MDIKKFEKNTRFNPWNWFKHEETAANKDAALPSKHGEHLAATPANDLLTLHKEINRLFDDMFQGFPTLTSSPFMGRLWEDAPPMFRADINIANTDKDYTITLEAPGMDEKDMEVELKDHTLFIRGNKKQEKEEKEQDFYHVERHYGSFERVLSIPDDGDTHAITAEMKNGVLAIHVPRMALPPTENKRIDINQTA